CFSYSSSLLTFYYKRLNFRKDLIFVNFANHLRFAKNRSREQSGQYINTTEATFDSKNLETANNYKFAALGPIRENVSPRKLSRLQYIRLNSR
ncbi:MAG: hypothetical protein PV344_07170, partial [Anaplasma sp.]|nr:hypothetical protein [Anaplasma sp.]